MEKTRKVRTGSKKQDMCAMCREFKGRKTCSGPCRQIGGYGKHNAHEHPSWHTGRGRTTLGEAAIFSDDNETRRAAGELMAFAGLTPHELCLDN